MTITQQTITDSVTKSIDAAIIKSATTWIKRYGFDTTQDARNDLIDAIENGLPTWKIEELLDTAKTLRKALRA